jgi:VanZ family protein
MTSQQNITLRIVCAGATVLLIAGLFIAGQAGYLGGLFRSPVDKFVHFGFWFFCATLAQIAGGPNPLRRWLILLLLLLLAALDETVQIWTMGRHAEFADAIANAIGISTAAVAGFTLRRLYR